MLGSLLEFFLPSKRHQRVERPLEKKSGPRLGIALSSGGARGLAHVGVLQVLEENGIEIHAIAGSSMGAYVGALWAAGFSGSDLADLAREMEDPHELWKLADPVIPPLKGLFHGIKARKHLERSIGDLRIEDLERQLLIVAVDIETKERVVIQNGRLSEAVHASCAMPGIVAPVTINGRRCVDGGVADPLPVGVLRKFAEVDRIIAVSVIPTFEQVDSGVYQDDFVPNPSLTRRLLSKLNRHVNVMAKGNVVDTFRQSIRAAQIRIAHDSVRHADLCLRPEHFTAAWHDYSNFERFIESGRKVALDHLDEIRELLNPNHPHHEKPVKQLVGKSI